MYKYSIKTGITVSECARQSPSGSAAMPCPNCSAFSVFPSVSVARRVLVSAARQRAPARIKDKHTPRSHRGNKGHISGQKGYWFFEAFMEQKQSDESPRKKTWANPIQEQDGNVLLDTSLDILR